jgi:hypothetical protein
MRRSTTVLVVLGLAACSKTHPTQATPDTPVSVPDAGDGASPSPADASIEGSAPVPTRSKRAALTKAIGTHALESISGFSGANTLYDVAKEHGRWTATTSMNIGGTRQASSLHLTRQDVEAFGAMRVEVDGALTVRVLAKGKTLLETPFDESHMDYRFHAAHDDRSELSKLQPSTRFVDDQLMLSLVDGVKYSDVFATKTGFIDADSAAGPVTLSYAPADDSFEMHLYGASCCSEYDFRFVRAR